LQKQKNILTKTMRMKFDWKKPKMDGILKKKTILKMMSNKISSNEKNKDQIWNIKQITGGEIEKHF
jgi:hypothetical protein